MDILELIWISIVIVGCNYLEYIIIIITPIIVIISYLVTHAHWARRSYGAHGFVISNFNYCN